jgi:hypothetical protein
LIFVENMGSSNSYASSALRIQIATP